MPPKQTLDSVQGVEAKLHPQYIVDHIIKNALNNRIIEKNCNWQLH